MKKRRLFEDLKNNPKNVRFEKLCKIVEAFGFRFKGGKGSHRIYVQEEIGEMLYFQNVGGKAKPYQVKQFIKIVEKYNLLEEFEHDV
ncbi:MAG TPA: type II toxin-antitoxin system HicA family toxin [Methanosarcinaceae archaeon]|nr:type II toxin-antitoxin system HicA family toxin [Methanosarcinaceae archaeon]